MKSKFLGLFLLMASPVLAGSFFFGFGRGVPYRGYGYYRPPVIGYVAPPVYGYAPSYYAPGATYYGGGYGYGGYGSGYGYGGSYGGYYGPRPYAGAVWVAPRYYRGRSYRGYWRR